MQLSGGILPLADNITVELNADYRLQFKWNTAINGDGSPYDRGNATLLMILKTGMPKCKSAAHSEMLAPVHVATWSEQFNLSYLYGFYS